MYEVKQYKSYFYFIVSRTVRLVMKFILFFATAFVRNVFHCD
jgi:hypothetical protein